MNNDAAMLEACRKFTAWLMREWIGFEWACHDIDGFDVQEKLTEFGILRETTYDPAIHGETLVADPGDTWYVLTDIGSAMLSRDAEPPK